MSKEEVKSDKLGHHKRLRERYLKTGLSGFHDYEILELLLTYTYHYRDTKPIAKELIDRFKTLKGVFRADIPELQEIKGIGERTAIFLKILNDSIGYIFEQSAEEEMSFTKIDEVVEYLRATIGNLQNEVMRIIYLNSKNQIIHAENLSEGTVSETAAFPRQVVEGAVKYHAASVIMAHNHPGGVAEPSEEDDSITERIKRALETINVNLQDHIIVSDQGFYSYKKYGILD